MIEIDEKFVALWFLSITETQDWMCGLRELEPNSRYEIIYRFRYYKDDKSFDSKDEKSWYRAKACGTRAFCLMTVRSIAKRMESQAGTRLYEIVNDGDVKDFLNRLLDAPFATARMKKG